MQQQIDEMPYLKLKKERKMLIHFKTQKKILKKWNCGSLCSSVSTEKNFYFILVNKNEKENSHVIIAINLVF